MKLVLKVLFIAALTFIVSGQFAARAQGPGGYNDPNRLYGTVTAIDTTANTLTVHDRRADTDTTVSLTTDTKYTKQTVVPITTLAVGSFVNASGREDIPAGATSVDASRIEILTALPTDNRPNTRGVVGTVLTTTPTLTAKAADGTTWTINTTDETQVSQTDPAVVTDVVVGSNVQVETKAVGNTVTADTVRIVPARRPRPAGGAGQ